MRSWILFAGHDSTCATRANGTYMCWGDDAVDTDTPLVAP